MQIRAVATRVFSLGLVILFTASCSTSGDSDASGSVNSETQINLQCLDSIEPLERPKPELPVTLESATGNSVSITSIDRVVALAPGSAEIVWALGLGDSVAGKDLVSVFPGSDETLTVNPGHEVSLETVLSINPTLVLADDSEENSDAVQKLAGLGIPVAVIPDATTVTQISPRITAIANALGVPAAGEKLVSLTEGKLQQVASLTMTEKSIAFLYLRGNAGVYLIGGKGSGADSIISALGAKDSGTELGIEGFAPLTAESLAKANPDVLLVMNEGLESVGGLEKLLALPGISTTRAAQNSAVIQADDRVLLAFGPQTPNVISCLALQLSTFNEPA
jgi:iron complex transport system substrate-binding protein